MGNSVESPITNPDLPHQRELIAIIELAFNAYQNENYLGLVITDTREHASWILGRLKDSVRWDIPDTRFYRDGIEVKGGGKVVIHTANDPGRLMGLRATEIVLFGRIGELFYWLQSNNLAIPWKAIA